MFWWQQYQPPFLLFRFDGSKRWGYDGNMWMELK
jgi:hypothetical protein